MNAQNLRFVAVIEARKPHLMFEQADAYYLFTSKEEDTRGSFYRVGRNELAVVEKQLASPTIDDCFHIDDIWHKIRGFARRSELKEREPEYVKSRLRNICYVLVAQGTLRLEKRGRRIFFCKRSKRA